MNSERNDFAVNVHRSHVNVAFDAVVVIWDAGGTSVLVCELRALFVRRVRDAALCDGDGALEIRVYSL